MYGKVVSACIQGIEGVLIEVELDISSGLPQMSIVGLADLAIRESIDRVRAAIKNSGFLFPMDRITVNLAPADLPKEGSAFDLAIAIGILTTSKQINLDCQLTLIIGEISLEGTLRPVHGVLSMVEEAKKRGFQRVILAEDNAQEARLIEGIHIVALHHLKQLKSELNLIINGIYHNGRATSLNTPPKKIESVEEYVEDYKDVIGQHQAKRVLMIAASGRHNLLFIGPPGTGKTMLLRRLPGILSEMCEQEALEVTKIRSTMGLLKDRTSLVRQRPFRAPHHTITAAGLMGGGSLPKPGEISMAHHGILYLDELPEFSRQVLESLRQPLEEKVITIARARAVYSFPAHFMLVASMNPCPCGYRYSETEANPCHCSSANLRNYRNRISGPLLDRIDLHVDVPRMDYEHISDKNQPLGSSEMKHMVSLARARQLKRYQSHHLPIQFNNELRGKWLRQFCRLRPDSERLLKQYYTTVGLSTRAHDRILRIARTIADLEDYEDIQLSHLAEALQYRQLDKKRE